MTTPRHPDEMPSSFHNGDTPELRNCLISLDQFQSVSVNWEMDVNRSNAEGEICGKWSVEIHTHGKRFMGEHESITNALWFAYTCAKNFDSEEYAKRDRLRCDALAKLTKEERMELGL